MSCYWNHKGRRYVSYAEARTVLRFVDDAARAHAIWFLATAFIDSWKSFGKPFIQKAWPLESRFQTADVSQQFAFLAEQADDRFPDVVQTVLHLIVPVRQLDTLFHQAIRQTDQGSLASRFPAAMLDLLDRLASDDLEYAPYGLETVLETIATERPRLRDDVRWKRLKGIADVG